MVADENGVASCLQAQQGFAKGGVQASSFLTLTTMQEVVKVLGGAWHLACC